MEEIKDECPTEILVELKEDSFVPSRVNHNDFENLLDGHKSDVHLKDEEHLAFDRKSEAYKCILDMSPFRIKEKFCHRGASNIDFEAKQDLKADLNIDDCPTGILVDLPNNSDLPLKSCAFSYKTPYTRVENKVSHLQNSVIETTDSEKEVYLSTGIKNCRLSDDTDKTCCSKPNEGESKSFASRSRFKTPSPQSMSLISSEVSKVINTLNSSITFDEDDLLNEEMLPIPLNFDDFDDISDREKQLPKVTDVCGNKIGDHEISTSVQTQDSSRKSDENIECTIFHPGVNEKLKVSSTSENYPSPLPAEADILDREKQLPKVTGVYGNKIGNREVSTSVQTQDSSKKSDEIIECTIFHPDVNEKLKVSSTSENYLSPLPAKADISDREKQLPKVTGVYGNKIGNREVSSSIQTQFSSNKSDENIECDTIFHPDLNENLKVSSTSEAYPSPLSAEAGCSPAYSYNAEKTASDEHSKEHISCEIKSDSLDISRISASADSADDVFSMSHITDEDKENDQRHEGVLPKKSLKISSTLQKKSFISEKKGSRETLKNLSNIKPKYVNKDSALRLSQNSHNKQKEAPQMKMSNISKTKMLQPPPNKKLQLKKTVSAMESRTVSRRMSMSNSFHFQSSKELIPSMQRPSLVEQNTSFRPNLSHKSYIKQENLDKMKSAFATPSRRYSISTPLKGAALKPQFTPLLQGSQNRALPRFTPQSVGSSRLSFSKSLQSSSKNSHFSMKQECSTSSVSSKLNQPSVARLNLTKPDKSIVQDAFPSNSKILGKSSLSTSNTKKFCSKLSLPSPFSAVQDKHLARVLFPSDP